MSPDARRPVFVFPIRSDTIQPVQSKKQARSLKIRIKKNRHCTICEAKTKGLISFTVTVKLIWAFVFAWAKFQISHFLYMSLSENKGKHQLCVNCTVYQHLWFHFTDSTLIFLFFLIRNNKLPLTSLLL